MQEAQKFLFFAAFLCLILFGVILSTSIVTKSLLGIAASFVWLVLAATFTQRRKNLIT